MHVTSSSRAIKFIFVCTATLTEINNFMPCRNEAFCIETFKWRHVRMGGLYILQIISDDCLSYNNPPVYTRRRITKIIYGTIYFVVLQIL